MADGWTLRENAFSMATARAWEGLLTVGSGYMHTRASLEEHLASAPQNVSTLRTPANVTAERFDETGAKWGTYVPGVFGPHPMLNNEMINLPWFLGLAPWVDGEKLDMQASTVRGGERVLEMHSATLHRRLVWHTRSGPVVTVEYDRFISASRPSLSVQRMTLQADRNTLVEVRAGIEADVRTGGFDHFESADIAPSGPAGIRCEVRTNGGDRCTIVSRLTGAEAQWRYRPGMRRGELVAVLELKAGRPVVVEKRTAVSTTRDIRERDPERVLSEQAEISFEDLHREHAATWESRWRTADVAIGGDTDSQLALRVGIYHLLRTHAAGNPGVAVDAKGYAGDAYFGRFFWDTEMYLLPFHLYTDPARARTLVDFRINSLDGARRNAKRYGYPGARYAWESDPRGDEQCPNWQYCDHEVHVTADVAYGFAHYAAAVDPEYVHNEAPNAIVETARYWLARMDWRKGEDHPSLLGVMGPDEYTPLSSNNAYTNRMVAHHLELAARVGRKGGASVRETHAFAEAAAALSVLRHPDNPDLVMQCEEFDRLAEPDFQTHWPDRSVGFASVVSQERLYRTKCLKQADVIMLMAMFPDEFSDAECRAAWDYYVPYTTHDSSLSAGIHALMALRLGLRDEAWRLFRAGLRKDLDVLHGGAAEGVHIANCGCNWMVTVMGFAGMRTAMQSDVLSLRPRLPAQWTRLAFPVVWKGIPVRVTIEHGTCKVNNQGDTALHVDIEGQPLRIRPGATESFSLRA